METVTQDSRAHHYPPPCQEKERILDALEKFISRRPGFDYSNYAPYRDAYRADVRTATRQLRDARTLMAAISWRSGITAESLKAAFSRRLSVTVTPDAVRFEYTAGQYPQTEYRGAAASALAYALWDYTRDYCMPEPVKTPDGYETYNGMSAGEWLRKHFRREFGRGIADRYFT